jgi:CDP-4-dehydro-6-deoxyglucose reductase, E1
VSNRSRESILSDEILDRVRELGELRRSTVERFVPGRTPVRYAGRVYDEHELLNLVESALEFWLTAGRWHRRFEAELARWYGLPHAIPVNSGSSANLLAISALTTVGLGVRMLEPGDEVITVAAGFPTTVGAILHSGLVPVFVDVDIPTYNLDVTKLEEARSSKTRAVFVAHTLGNPFDISAVQKFCADHGLWFVEDNCDAAGSLYKNEKTGTFGDLATLSFYPPHHMTTGEGGAILCRSEILRRAVESLRDWGRDCWCPPGVDNACGRRFSWQLGDLPAGYDHKYVFSNVGYNLKITDMQAAVGLAQLDKLERFGTQRRENWQFYREELSRYEDVFVLPEPTRDSDPSWFGLLLTVRPTARFTRDEIVQHLESRQIQTRMLFAGNMTRQPALIAMQARARASGREEPFRIAGTLTNTDTVMSDSFWIGVYPGITDEMRTYVANEITRFVDKHSVR